MHDAAWWILMLENNYLFSNKVQTEPPIHRTCSHCYGNCIIFIRLVSSNVDVTNDTKLRCSHETTFLTSKIAAAATV